jgi:hypothetical protein
MFVRFSPTFSHSSTPNLISETRNFPPPALTLLSVLDFRKCKFSKLCEQTDEVSAPLLHPQSHTNTHMQWRKLREKISEICREDETLRSASDWAWVLTGNFEDFFLRCRNCLAFSLIMIQFYIVWVRLRPFDDPQQHRNGRRKNWLK